MEETKLQIRVIAMGINLLDQPWEVITTLHRTLSSVVESTGTLDVLIFQYPLQVPKIDHPRLTIAHSTVQGLTDVII